jgi:hypothetical protein
MLTSDAPCRFELKRDGRLRPANDDLGTLMHHGNMRLIFARALR